MNQQEEDIADLCAELESKLRLRTFPLGLKRVATLSDVEPTEGWKEMDFVADGCQYVTQARTAGWAFKLTKDNICPCAFAWAMGLVDERADALARWPSWTRPTRRGGCDHRRAQFDH